VSKRGRCDGLKSRRVPFDSETGDHILIAWRQPAVVVFACGDALMFLSSQSQLQSLSSYLSLSAPGCG
jgi:hypothetical protein